MPLPIPWRAYSGFLVLALMLSSCLGGDGSEPESKFKPVLMKRQVLENSYRVKDPRDIRSAHKIYVQDSLLLVLEQYEGIHLIDNSDPSNPLRRGFLHLPGTQDIAMKDHYLYADNAVDLVTIDLSKWPPPLIDRDRNVLPEIKPPDNLELVGDLNPANWPDSTVVIKWEER